MNAYRIRPVKYPWPAIFYFAAILLSLAIQRVMPMHLPDRRLLLLQGLGDLFDHVQPPIISVLAAPGGTIG